MSASQLKLGMKVRHIELTNCPAGVVESDIAIAVSRGTIRMEMVNVSVKVDEGIENIWWDLAKVEPVTDTVTV